MDPKMLNSQVREAAGKAGFAGMPERAVRFDRNFSGGAGEGFLLAFSGKLLIIDREFGAEFRTRVWPGSEVEVRKAVRDGNRMEVELRHGAEDRIAGSALFGEANDLLKLVEEVRECRELIGSGELSRSAALYAAGLLYIANADGDIDAAEEKMIHRLCSKRSLLAGLEYASGRGVAEFAAETKKAFSRSQKISLLANQLEVAMCDGSFCRREMNFFLEEVALWEFPLEEYKEIRDIILLKNQAVSLFFTGGE